MRRIRPLAALGLGFALGTLAGQVLRVGPASAQQAWTADIDIPKTTVQRQPMTVRPRSARVTASDDGDAVQPSMPGVTSDALQPMRNGARGTPPERMQSDGQTEPPVSADLAVDGHMIVAEPLAPNDGVERFAADPRLPEDRAAFLSPPAGYDNLAFQIELDPLADARPVRLAQMQPFQPLGYRAGNWVFFPTIEAGIGGTTNVYKTSHSQPDLIFDVRPTLLVVTDLPRHAMSFKVTGLASAYDRFSTEDDRSYAYEGRGRVDISNRSNVEIMTSHSREQESQFSTFAPTDAAKRTPYSTDKIAAAYNQRIEQLSLQVRGSVIGTNFEPVAAYNGSIIDNSDRDLVSRDLAMREAWNFSPALAVFAETAINNQSYRTIAADGINRDSVGNRMRVGLSFGSASQIWRGEISAGYGRQRATDTRLQDVQGVLIDANLAWRPSQITSVLLNARTDFVTSTLPGQGNGTAHLASIELRHAFQRRLNGIANLSYQETDYQGISLVERLTAASIGFEYYMTRSTTLLTTYQHSIVTSTVPSGNATVDTLRLGVKWQP